MDELILNYIHPASGEWVEVGPLSNNGWEESAQSDAENVPSMIFFLTKEVVTTDVDGEYAVHPTN